MSRRFSSLHSSHADILKPQLFFPPIEKLLGPSKPFAVCLLNLGYSSASGCMDVHDDDLQITSLWNLSGTPREELTRFVVSQFSGLHLQFSVQSEKTSLALGLVFWEG